MIVHWVVKWEDQFTPLDTACRELRAYRYTTGWLFGKYDDLIYRIYEVGPATGDQVLYMRGEYSGAYRILTGGFGFTCDGVPCGIWVVQSEGSGGISYMLVLHVGYAVHVGKNRYVGPKLVKPW